MSPSVIVDAAQPALAPVLGLRTGVEPAGSVLTSVEAGRSVVWLRGEIDFALADDLCVLAAKVVALGPHVVVEVSRMTFCDSTVVNFIAAISGQVAVTVRRPPRWLVELLGICDLTGHVQLANFPGIAPPLPG